MKHETTGSPHSVGHRIVDFLERYGVLVAFALLFAANAIWQGEVFLKPESLRNLLNQNAATGIIAVGMTLVIIAGGIDLSVGAVMAFAAALAMMTLNGLIGTAGEGMGEVGAVWIGLATGVAVGAACGALNGLMVTLGRIPAFIATLAGLVGFRSVTLALAKGGEIRSSSGEFLQSIGRGGIPVPGLTVGNGQPLTIYWSIVVLAVVVVAGQVLLSRTRLGRHFVAVGSNELAARYSGIPVGRVRVWGYTIVGVCAGIAGLTQMARMNSVSSSQLGLYAELDAIAAVVIGGTSMAGGRGRVWGTLVGVLILGMISQMLVTSGVEVYWQGFVKGVIIVLAVLVQRGRRF